jgi:hypothetical protein
MDSCLRTIARDFCFEFSTGSSSSVCLLIPWCLPGRMFGRNLIPPSAYRIAGAGTVEGSGIQSEADEGDQMHGWNTTEENGEVVIGSRHRLCGKQLMY